MFRYLLIKDFVVVCVIEFEFGLGMIVVSGEIGVGKLLMVDVLGFLFGLCVDSGVVCYGVVCVELLVEFVLFVDVLVWQWLCDNEFDDEDQCQLCWIICVDGGLWVWINGWLVILLQFIELVVILVEIYGQYEQQVLLLWFLQLVLLDVYVCNEVECSQVCQVVVCWQVLVDEVEVLFKQGDVSDCIGFFEYQLGELQCEDLDFVLIVVLGSSYCWQVYVSVLISVCDVVVGCFNGDDDVFVLQLLQQIWYDFVWVVEYDICLGEVDVLLDSVFIQLYEVLLLLDWVYDDFDVDLEQFEDIECWLGCLYDLVCKYWVLMEVLGEYCDVLDVEVEQLWGVDECLQVLVGEIQCVSG